MKITSVLELMAEGKVTSAHDKHGVVVKAEGDVFVFYTPTGEMDHKGLEKSDFAVEWEPVYDPVHEKHKVILAVLKSKKGPAMKTVLNSSIFEIFNDPTSAIGDSKINDLCSLYALEDKGRLRQIWDENEEDLETC